MVKQKRDIKYDQLSCVCYKQTNEATWRHTVIRSVAFLLQKNKNRIEEQLLSDWGTDAKLDRLH